MRRQFESRVAGLLFCCSALISVSAAAQSTVITSDGTLGTVINRNGILYNIDNGTLRGRNLFQSFGRFDLGAGDIASFNSPAGTVNILGRVTGGDGSDINGMIRSSTPGANIFFMNPFGVVFGADASLDVQGSFHATTADYIKLADGELFRAIPSAGDALLSSASPAAFGFLSANPAPIDVQAGVFDFNSFEFSNIFNVPIGETLSFVGGDVHVGAPRGAPPAGFLFAPGGRINLVSVASAGEAGFDGSGFDVAGFSRLGNVAVDGGALVDATDIFIRGGQLVINDGTLFPGLGFIAGFPVPPPDGGQINIDVTGDVHISGTRPGLAGLLPGIQVFNGSAGGPVPGDAPDVNIKAGSLTVSGIAGIQATRLGPGAAADVTIHAGEVTLSDGGSIDLSNFFEGPGGSLLINTGSLTLTGDDPFDRSGLFAVSDFHPAYGQPGVPFLPFFQFADSASISVNATATVGVFGQSQISADSFAFGRSGDVTIQAGNVRLSGAGANSGAIAAQSGLAGNSGSVRINADGNISIENGFRVSATTFGSGDAGVVELNAGGSITLSGADSRVLSGTIQAPDQEYDQFAQHFAALAGAETLSYAELRVLLGIEPANGDLMLVLQALSSIPGPGGNPLVAVTDFTEGNAGTVTLTTPTLSMGADTRIETSTGWDGDAGSIVANTGYLSLAGGATIRSRSGIERLDGTIAVGAGRAGNVTVNGTGMLSLISISGFSPTTGARSSISTSTLGAGDGGAVNLDADTVYIGPGGEITADSAGAGLTGDITVNAGVEIGLLGGRISTSARTSDGGNITLTAPRIIRLTDSEITTSVESGEGGGGNIFIDPEFVVLNNSRIIANAFGGPGGNIRIVANNFVPSADSLVEASSARDVAGTIVIESPENDLAGSIAQLPQSFLDASALLPAGCEARRSGAQSSFVVAGPGGVPFDPDGYLPSFEAGATLPPLPGNSGTLQQAAAAGQARAHAIAQVMAGLDCLGYRSAASGNMVDS